MKKWFCLGIIAAIIVGVLICFNFKKNQAVSSDIVYEGVFDKNIIEEENYVFTDYDDYHNKFHSGILTENNFINNNYVVISMLYDSCSESNIVPTVYNMEGNNIEIMVKYKASCGVCSPKNMYYLLKVDKNITSANVNIKYEATNKPNCHDQQIDYKPLIYIYPEQVMDVTIKLGYPEKLTTTYPKYKNEWKVTAYPNGDLKDDNNTYYGLYWEGFNYLKPTFEDGFVVKGNNVISFLEEKLTILGLNDKEKNEFIIYWLPKLESNKYNLIRFENIENINKDMPLDINPKPDTIIRILMEFKPLDKKINIKEQKLTTPKREGFTVVEWGGSEIK